MNFSIYFVYLTVSVFVLKNIFLHEIIFDCAGGGQRKQSKQTNNTKKRNTVHKTG